MRVLLVNPPWFTNTGYGIRSNSRWPHTRKDKVLPFPIYLAYAAAVLEKNGHDVGVLDAVAEDITTVEDLKASIERNYDLVVVETSTPSIHYDLEAVKALKEEFDTKTALIGPHSTIFDGQLLSETPEIDFVLRGEYEYTLLELCNSLENNEDLSNIKGLTFRYDNEIKRNDDRELIANFDELPFPARHLFDMKKYDTHLYRNPSFLMISSRGCPFRCIYCLWPKVMYGRKFRARSPESVVDEMELLINEYGAKEICFDDDTFTTNKKRVIAICDEIKRRGLDITWNCFGRVDTVDGVVLKKMKEVGCEMIRYGVESGSQELLDAIKKNITLKQAKKAFKMTRKAGIKAYGTFMFGLPGETWETVRNTIEFSKEIDPDVVQFSIVTPFPGTEYYDIAKDKGMLKADKWDEYDGSHSAVIETEALSGEDLEKAVAMAWKEFYISPEFIIKSVWRNLGSFHEMKRLVRGAKSFIIRYMDFREMA